MTTQERCYVVDSINNGIQVFIENGQLPEEVREEGQQQLLMEN